MTVVLPSAHHARPELIKNGVDCISESAARHQDIRPLRIGILNIMPKAEEYEFNLLLPLGRSVLQILPVWIRLESHAYNSADPYHLARYYVPFAEAMRTTILDGLIVTGAPVEEMPYEDVHYWPELTAILGEAQKKIPSTLGICWGGLALAKFVGIEKMALPKKVFGVFPTRNLKRDHPITGGLDDVFWCPQSRHAGIADKVLEQEEKAGHVNLLAYAEGAGYTIFETSDHRFIMHLGHQEYNSKRLVFEAERDRKANRPDVGAPVNFDLHNPVNNWRGNRNEFFSAWIRYVYLTTKFDMSVKH
jgi:homoserine O-succinyltransferase